MKRKLIFASIGLGLSLTEAYLQNKISKNRDEKIEKLITEVRDELSGSRIELTPKQIKLYTSKLNIERPDGEPVLSERGLKADEITVGKHEKQFNNLKTELNYLEECLDNRLNRLESEMFSAVEEDPDENVSYQPIYGHWGMDVANKKENTTDKSPVLSEEDDKTTKSIIEMVSHLDENYLNRLRANLDGTYVYDMEDFHALVTQLFILQEDEKAKNTKKEVR